MFRARRRMPTAREAKNGNTTLQIAAVTEYEEYIVLDPEEQTA